MSKGIIDSLLPVADDVLSLRDTLGAVIDKVFFVTRTWSGDEVGTGTPVDTLEQLLPSPCLKRYDWDLRLREGGNVKAGDILLKGISLNKYTEADLDGTSPAANIEKLFLVGDKIYTVINLHKRYVTWEVLVRKISNQERYDAQP